MKKKIKMALASVLMVTLLFCFKAETVEASQKTNWQIVKELCRKAGKPIKLIKTNELTDKQSGRYILNRKGKPYILVEKVVSKSDGTGHRNLSDYGWYSTKTKGTNYIIGYNKRVKRGKTVTSYIIYDPNSNEPDEILWVVDNKTYR